MENNIHVEESILFRYLRGTATGEEIACVEKWMEASADNKKTAEQLCVINYGMEALRCMYQARPYTSLAGVKRKLRRNRLRRVAMWGQRTAAALFIPFFCLSLYSYYTWQRKMQKETMQQIEISSAPGTTTATVLPDGTQVWLNSGSSLKYPVRFGGETREISLRGEAYMIVAKNPKRPFVIDLEEDLKVKVTGTELNVEAYPYDSVRTTLLTGEVQLISADQLLLTLKPGEQSVWDKDKKKIHVRKVNTTASVSWKEGKIVFKDTPIEEIAATLGRRYNVQFVVSQRLKDQRFTGTFTRLQLVQILEHFRISSKIRYEIKESPIHTDGTYNCPIVELK